MKRELKMATFTFSVPLTFKFNALRDTDNETLWKMANAYIDLVLKFGDYEINDKMLNLIREEKVLTESEKAEQIKDKKLLEEIFKINEGRRDENHNIRIKK